jgi:hypothetical protein
MLNILISEDWRVGKREKPKTNLEQMEEGSDRRNEGWNFTSRLGTTDHGVEVPTTSAPDLTGVRISVP